MPVRRTLLATLALAAVLASCGGGSDKADADRTVRES
jgi:ABC-type glycerol-3-phosphate transport system substrate-binding protein